MTKKVINLYKLNYEIGLLSWYTTNISRTAGTY